MDNSNIKIHIGSKFFRYIDKDNEQALELIRILKANPIKDKIRYFDMHTGKANTIDYKTLIDNYSELSPDGSIIFAVASIGNANDVIVALKDYANRSKNELPYAVCRQSIHDFFQDFNKEDFRRISVGISVSQDTCPSNIDFGQVLTCDASKEIYQKHIMIYLDDTLDDILKLVRSTKYDNALKKLKTMAYQEARQEGFNENNIIGYCESLRDLLESNTFMYDFRKCFNIVEVPFHIDPDRDTLNGENILYLEKEFKCNIMETYMIEYTREIDLKSIKRDYCLISSAKDNFNKVYIIGYDKADGEYVPRSTV